MPLMEQEPYLINIENWANSIIELEENHNYQSRTSDKEHAPNSSLVSTMPTYYRSKAFSSHIGINNLINAADPILTLITKLRRITIPPDINILHQNICHEIKAFENKAENLGYRSQLIIAARYVICALLDEQISLVLWPNKEWKQYSFVETFHKEQWEDDRFFIILDRSLQDAVSHLDLLELIYLCLRLGYEGKYRTIDKGHEALLNITDHLYMVIMQYRDEFSRGLLISLDHFNPIIARKKNYFHLLPPAWLTSTLMIFSLLIIFSIFYFKLIETASPISKFLTTLQTNDLTEEASLTAK